MAIAEISDLPKLNDPKNFAPVIDLNDLSVAFGKRQILKGLQGELRAFIRPRPELPTSLAKTFLLTPNRSEL